MKKEKETRIIGKMLEKLAPQIGATVLIEPKWRIVAQITFKNGKRSYVYYSSLDINPAGSSEVAKDKDYANFFMEKLGYPIIPGSATFFSDEWGATIGAPHQNIDAAYRHAEKIGFPVIVKPNSGSQGLGVTLVRTKQEFYSTVRRIFKYDRIVMVQKPVTGRDYRLVVLDDSIISAYERIPLNVIGDGKKNISELLTLKQKEFIKKRRDAKIHSNDPRIQIKLKHQKLSFESIPKKGERVYLLENANLSTGGDSVDVTHTVHEEFKKIAIQLTKDMGLRICGVDLMVDGDISQVPTTYNVLEINASPGFDHYSKIGPTQEKIIEDLYLQALKDMERRIV